MTEIKTYNNPVRVGNFTSSEIYMLCSCGEREMTAEELAARPKKGKGSRTTLIADRSIPGASYHTYIDECNLERELQRPLVNESSAKPLSWGKIAEKKAFQELGLDYQLVSSDTIVHPEFDCWSGSPDVNKFDEGNTVCDIKSPLSPKSFTTLVKPLYKLGLSGLMAMEWIRANHDDGEKFYWQLVSNALLTNSKYAELIVYCPYKSELEGIRELVSQIDNPLDQRPFYWIYVATDEELPWLPDGGFYKNLSTIRFAVPESDKKFLTERVTMAERLLISRAF